MMMNPVPSSMLRLCSAALVAAACLSASAAAADTTGRTASPATSATMVIALQQPGAAAAQPAPEGFEPVGALPAPRQEQLPAAPLVMAAYGFIWVLLLGFLWSIWRRLGAVEREMKSVEQRVAEAGKRW